MVMAKISNPMSSDNPWNAGFSNLGLALFGDPATSDKAQLGAYREAETTKTYDEINRKLRADKALESLQTAMSTVFNVPQGQTLSEENYRQAMPYLSQYAIGADYKPSDLADLMRTGAAYSGGGSDFKRNALIATGTDPGLDFAGSQQEAEAISRGKPITLSPGEQVVMPKSRFASTTAPTSMADTIAPQTASVQSEQLPVQPTPHQAPEVYKQTILDEAEASGIPPEILTEVLWRESKFRLNALGTSGERGMAQTMVDTAAAPGYGADPYTPGVDPGADIHFAAQYLSGLKKQYGTWDAALTAYNWGAGNYEKGGIGGRPASTTDYVTDILRNAGLQPDQAQTTQAAVTQQQPVQVADASGGVPDIFGPGGGVYTAPKPEAPLEVSGGASVYERNPNTGLLELKVTAPKMPDVVSGGATTKVGQPTPADDQRIRELLSNQLGVDINYFTQNVLGTLPDADLTAYVKAVDDAWNTSNGNINDAVVAGLNWLNSNYDIAKPTDPSGPFNATDFSMVPKQAPATPAAPAAGTASAAAPAQSTAMPAAQDRVVGTVYDTPAHGPLRWTGVPGAEWEEP